jgi:glycosyltransferase involved in cell wall biosynthesis
MKVLILTQYYLPENPPGAHRLSSFAKSLVEYGHHVEILTTFPNYPNMKPFDGYTVKGYKREIVDGIIVHRSWIYLNPKKRMIDRLISFISFLFSSLFIGLCKIDKPEVIICLSPPFFTCFTGVFLKWRFRSKLILNIADLWPESGVKLGLIKNSFIIWLTTRMELFFYRQADGIACQTMGILNNIKQRTKSQNLIWFKNGVDFSYYEKIKIEPNLILKINLNHSDLVIGYTGLIGYAQGMEILVKAAILLKHKLKVTFLIIGDGPKSQEMKDLVSNYELDNFIFVGNQPKHLMPTYLSMVDITIAPLVKTDIYLGALPSKIFDSFAVKKSVLLGVDGEARELFCKKYNCAFYFEPENHEELAKLIMRVIADKDKAIEYGERGYELMKTTFNRKFINQEFILYLIEIAKT